MKVAGPGKARRAAGAAAGGGALLPRFPNFRDLGGAPTADGRRVRPGRFFRAPALTGLTEAEAEALLALDPALVVDLRSAGEVAAAPVDLPGPLAGRRLAIELPPLVDERFASLLAGGQVRHETVAAAMAERYRELAREHAGAFARFLAASDAAGDGAVVFHCTAGKDRTGIAAALALAALGAPDAHVERDYLASGDLWRPGPELEALLPRPARAAVFGVSPSYLRAAFDEMERAHGGPRAFAEAALGGAARLDRWRARRTA